VQGAIEETPEHEVVVDDESIEGRALPIKVKTALQNEITIVRFAELKCSSVVWFPNSALLAK
jgi:hypothetical protein